MVVFEDSDLQKLSVNGVGPLVLVRWVDISGTARWVDKEDFTKKKIPEIETVGRIERQTPTLLYLSSTRDPFGAVNDTNLIPMVNVLEIVYLRPYKKREVVRQSASPDA